MKRRIHSSDNRGKMAIRAVIRFGRERHAWPSARELAGAAPGLGSASTVLRALRGLEALQRPPLIRLVRQGSESYWQPGADAFAIAKALPFTVRPQPSRKERESRFYKRRKQARKLQGRLDAVHVFDLASSDEGKPPPQAVRTALGKYTDLPPLPVYE